MTLCVMVGGPRMENFERPAWVAHFVEGQSRAARFGPICANWDSLQPFQCFVG